MIRPLSFDTVMLPLMSSSSIGPLSLSTSTGAVIPRTSTDPDPSTVTGRSAGIATVKSTLHQVDTNTRARRPQAQHAVDHRLDTSVAASRRSRRR